MIDQARRSLENAAEREMQPVQERVRWSWVDTALGRLLVASTACGVCFLALNEDDALARLHTWVRRHEPGAEIVEDPRALHTASAQLVAYARGERKSFDVELDMRGSEFQRSVWQALRRVPYGATRTYGEIARAIGRPAAMRAVGAANGCNPVPLFVPCHRIVASGGLGGFTGGLHHKRRLLALEGVILFD